MSPKDPIVVFSDEVPEEIRSVIKSQILKQTLREISFNTRIEGFCVGVEQLCSCGMVYVFVRRFWGERQPTLSCPNCHPSMLELPASERRRVAKELCETDTIHELMVLLDQALTNGETDQSRARNPKDVEDIDTMRLMLALAAQTFFQPFWATNSLPKRFFEVLLSIEEQYPNWGFHAYKTYIEPLLDTLSDGEKGPLGWYQNQRNERVRKAHGTTKKN